MDNPTSRTPVVFPAEKGVKQMETGDNAMQKWKWAHWLDWMPTYVAIGCIVGSLPSWFDGGSCTSVLRVSWKDRAKTWL